MTSPPVSSHLGAQLLDQVAEQVLEPRLHPKPGIDIGVFVRLVRPHDVSTEGDHLQTAELLPQFPALETTVSHLALQGATEGVLPQLFGREQDLVVGVRLPARENFLCHALESEQIT